jgi:hypothetical protein
LGNTDTNPIIATNPGTASNSISTSSPSTTDTTPIIATNPTTITDTAMGIATDSFDRTTTEQPANVNNIPAASQPSHGDVVLTWNTNLINQPRQCHAYQLRVNSAGQLELTGSCIRANYQESRKSLMRK